RRPPRRDPAARLSRIFSNRSGEQALGRPLAKEPAMRVLPLVLALSVAAPAVAAAAPRVSEVHVRIGPQLEAKAKEYGQRDLDELSRDLKSSIERALAAKGRMGADGGRLEVTITDATPNRPTFAQLGRNPSLSMRSIGVGGASMQAEEIGRD